MRHSNQSGFTLLEILATLAITAMLMVAGATLTDQRSQDIQDQNTAQYHAMINDAAVRYIQDNISSAPINAATTETATPAIPAKITFAMLVAGGYIPSGFTSAASNPYKQTPCVMVYKDPLANNPNNIVALMLSEGGSVIPESRLASIATLIGMSGGYISSKTPTLASGSYGKWSKPLTNYTSNNCSGVPSSFGHVASLLNVDSINSTQAYLYRSSVPGHPELNTMKTPIVLDASYTVGDACSAVGAIAQDKNANGAILTCSLDVITGTNKFASSGGSAYWKDPVNTFALLPACNAAAIGQSRVVKTPSVGSGPRAYTCDGAAWKALSSDDLGVTKSNQFQVNSTQTETAPCTTVGLVAKDNTGLLLSCQNVNGSTTWQKAQGGSTFYTSVGVSPGGSYVVPSGAKVIYGYLFVQWTGNNAGLGNFTYLDSAGSAVGSLVGGINGWNDGGSGSQWWFPVTIPVSAAVKSIRLTRTNGSNAMVWIITGYQT